MYPQFQCSVLRATVVAAIALATAFISFHPAHADQAFFMGLGGLPGLASMSAATDISGDGSVVVGYSGDDLTYKTDAFRWTRDTGMVDLGAIGTVSEGTGISTDGSTIIGYTGTTASGNYFPFRWTQQTGMVALPLGPANTITNPSASGIARGVNGDGSVIVGQRQDVPGTNIPLRWTVAGGTQVIVNSSISFAAQDVSDDGSVILVVGIDSNKYLWTAGTGLFPLPQPARGTWGKAWSISGNGKVVAGESTLAGDPIVTRRILRWSSETGTIELPPTPEGGVPFALDGGISADGSVIVGVAKGGLFANSSGNSLFIWDAVHGSRSLIDVLTNEYGLGPSLAGWTIPSAPNYWGVSGDGRTIYGDGLDPAGNQEGWIAHLGTVPEPSTFALAGCGAVLITLAGIGRRRKQGVLKFTGNR